MEFPNLKDAHLRLLFTLVFSYKRRAHAKEKGRSSTKNKNKKEMKEKQNSRARIKAAPMGDLRESIGI